MIGFRNQGRLGNFLFQSATTIAYAMKHGQEFSVPNRTIDNFWYPLYLQHLVNPKWVQGLEDILLNEQQMEYKEIEWNDEWEDKQVVLNGYYQSEKYFNEYRDEILYLFGYPYERKEDYVAVHVRRGDYLNLTQKHPPVTKDWYEYAMGQFNDSFKFKFFSDDLKWCRDTFGHRRDCEFSTNASEVDDLVEGSCCEHQIISSSTFGWWMAWMNRNPAKMVYIPRLWFVEDYLLNPKDVVPTSWIKL